MKKEKSTISEYILQFLFDTAGITLQLLPRPFETKGAWAKRLRHVDPNSYRRTIGRMRQKGLIEIVQKNGQKFIKLTASGQLEALFKKAAFSKQEEWDGKWRLLMFDIPESSKEKRDILRQMLKNNNFYRLQASVYIHPYPLNREAISYLRQSGLIGYIRIIRAEEMDDESELLKRFGLKRQIKNRTLFDGR